MLTYNQIRKLARAYSDKQMLNKDMRLTQGAGWWSNGFVMFLEKEPKNKSDKCEVADGKQEHLDDVMRQAEGSEQAWPVEMRAHGDRRIKAFVRFETMDGQPNVILKDNAFAVMELAIHEMAHYSEANHSAPYESARFEIARKVGVAAPAILATIVNLQARPAKRGRYWEN